MDIFSHGGDLKKAQEKYGIKREKIIDFSASINPLGLPSGLKRNIGRNIRNIIDYPDPVNEVFTESIVKEFDVKRENVLIGNGSNELIYLLSSAVSADKVLIPAPSYSEYERSSLAAGADCDFYHLMEDDKVKFDPEKVLESTDKAIKLLFMCNPHNPTGHLSDRDKLEYLINGCREKGITVLIDEAFMPFVKDDEKYSVKGLIEKYENLAVLRSMTKIYAIPGLRLGFILGNGLLIADMKKKQPGWQVNSLAQEAGPLLLSDKRYLCKSKNMVWGLKNMLYDELKKFSWIIPYYPSVNFIFCKLKRSFIDSQKLCDHMAEKYSILIRDCSSFRGLDNSYIRLAVKSRKNNINLIKCFQELEKELE